MMSRANNPDNWTTWFDPEFNETSGMWEVRNDSDIEATAEFRTLSEASNYIYKKRREQFADHTRRPRIFNDINPDTFEP